MIRGEDGSYSMFVMHLVEHCGIQCYQTNGEVLHAVSAKPQGAEYIPRPERRARSVRLTLPIKTS